MGAISADSGTQREETETRTASHVVPAIHRSRPTNVEDTAMPQSGTIDDADAKLA